MEPRNLFLAFLFVSLLILPVSAETLTGNLGGSNIVSTNYANPNNTATANQNIQPVNFLINDIEYLGTPTALIYWPVYKATYQIANNSKSSGQGPVNFYLGTGSTCSVAGQYLGSGTFGFQRFFDSSSPPVEQEGGYQWWTFGNLTSGGLTGDRCIMGVINWTLVMDGVTGQYLYNKNANTSFNAWTTGLPGKLYLGTLTTSNPTLQPTGQYTYNQDMTYGGSYSATKPSGIGITGTVYKHLNGSATQYSTQAFLYDSSMTLLSSEGIASTAEWNFATLSQSVIIGIKGPDGSFQYSPVLFGSTPTPTPTGPTPTNTPPPGTTTTNITITTRMQNGTQALLPNVFVKVYSYLEGGPFGENDWQSAVDGYTDSNGRIQFLLHTVTGYKDKFSFVKPGFFPHTYFLDCPLGTCTIEEFMNPDIGPNPEVPTNINITVQVKSDINYAPLSGAYVELWDSVSGTSKVAQNTNATGYAVFSHFPTSANIEGNIVKSGYQPLHFYVTSGDIPTADMNVVKYLYLTSSTITPTITPVQMDSMTLVASPNSIPFGGSSTLAVTATNGTKLTYAGGLDVITYYESAPSGQPYSLIGQFKNVNATYWKFRNTSDGAWGTPTTGNPLSLSVTPTVTGTITYRVTASSGGRYPVEMLNLYPATADLLVVGGGQSTLTMGLGAVDGTTISSMMNYNMNLTRESTGQLTDYGLVEYQKYVNLNRGEYFTLRCSKTGYFDGMRRFMVPIDMSVQRGDAGAYASCPMYPIGSYSAGNTTISVMVYDVDNQYVPLGNVQISVSANPIYSDSPKFTGADGSAVFFIIGQNTPYTIVGSKAGYCGVSDTGNTTTKSTDNIFLYMKRGCVAPTSTTTPPNGTPSIYPTTFIPGSGNETGGNGTFWNPWIKTFRMMGANTGEIPLLLAGLIIILCMAAGAGAAGILGAEAGMGFGAIFCVSVGFIPIWVVLCIIVLGFLMYGLKIGR